MLCCLQDAFECKNNDFKLFYSSFLFVNKEWCTPAKLSRGITLPEFRFDRESQARLLPENPSLTEKHIIGSVFKKPSHSVYSRAQRLSVCFSVFFLMTTANAMFYQTKPNKNTNFSITLAFITITWNQLYSSIMSVLIVYPPIMLMAELFRRSTNNKVGQLFMAVLFLWGIEEMYYSFVY